MNPYAPKEDTICYTCHKACTGECSWSDRLEPVPGWKVTQEEGMMSLTVNECPEYQKDIWKRDRVDHFDNGGCIRLLEAVAKVMRQDYVSGRSGDIRKNRQQTRAEIEKFLRSKRGQGMLMISDPEEWIQELRRQARRHDAMGLRYYMGDD